MPLRFGLLGPLDVSVDGQRLELGGPRRRRLLGMLLVHAGQALSTDALAAGVWDDDPPAKAEVTLRAHVAKLRRALAAAGGEGLVATQAPGYRLRVEPEHVDAHRFERLATAGRGALERDDPEHAAATLREALSLWRGAVLEDLDAPTFAEAEAARLEELRLAALAARIDADLALGRHEQLVGELEALVYAHPLREHLHAQLMLALYRSGRQADALQVCRAARQRLDDELGLAPGKALEELELAILRHDKALRSPPGLGKEAASTATPARSHPPTPPDGLLDVVRRVPMVGRGGELEQLRGLWHVARDGGRRVALVSGDAGVGKTRLVAELADRATAEGGVLLVGRCEQDALIPYQPVVDAVRTSPDALDALAQAPAFVRGQLGGLVAAGPPDAAVVSGLDDPSPGPAAFLDAVVGLFTGMTSVAPVMLVVEDAESIDRASARLLRHLAGHLPDHLLVVVCFRDPPGSRHPPLRDLLAYVVGRGLADRLTLAPLPESDLGALVRAWTGASAPTPFVHALWTSTGGNPFYAGEVVRDLAARGGLERAEHAWRVPTSVRDVLRERLRALSAASQEVMAGAAILGRDVDFRLLTQVVDASDQRVAEALDEATRAGWLTEAGDTGPASHAFRHGLMREAVHADIPAPHRQRLHLRAADALKAAGLLGAADVAAAAAHLRAAGPAADPQRTAEVSLQAADAAAAVYAWDEAVANAEAAVAVLDQAGAPAASRGDAAVRAAALLEKSSLDYPRAVEHLEAALEHYRAAGDAIGVATAHSRLGYVRSINHQVMDLPRALRHFAAAEPVLVDGEAAFEVHFGKAMAASFGLRIDEGRAAAQRALELAEGLDRRDLVAWARMMQVCPRVSHGELAAARRLLEYAWTMAQDLGDPHLAWEAALTAAITDSMLLLDPAAGEAACRRGLAEHRLATLVLGFTVLRDLGVYALASMGELRAAHDAAARLPDDAVSRRLLLLLDGEWEAAEGSWATALDRDLAGGDRLNALLNAVWLGQARLLLGRDDDAVAAFERALAISIDSPQVPGELMARAELARISAARGAIDAAAEHLARCDAILAADEDWRGQTGTVELARAALAAAHGQQARADAAHARALEVFTAYRLPWRCGETLAAWAGWLTAAGRDEDAAAKRRAAREQYAALGAHGRWKTAVVAAPEPHAAQRT